MLGIPIGSTGVVEVMAVRLFGSRSRRGRKERGGAAQGHSQQERKRGIEYLKGWAAERRGVEAYVEPETMMTETTVVFVAHDGEWTRRRVGRPDEAHDLGKRLNIPVYDIAKVGYPPRMRAYNARRRDARSATAWR